MQKVKETTSYSRPDQVPIVTLYQPLFAIAKPIQWQWPETFGEDKFIVILGCLHIESAAFKTIGNLLFNKSGWTAVLTEAWITSSGTAVVSLCIKCYKSKACPSGEILVLVFYTPYMGKQTLSYKGSL